MIPGRITLRLTADNGSGVEVALEHEYHSLPEHFDRDIVDMLERGSQELLRKYEALKKGVRVP